ncbi:MAG: hypothetical protein FWD23_17750 [Oscillospiraceae bacterium]|nr:hypothetical protein [Oscillospiraceae bacterium]
MKIVIPKKITVFFLILVVTAFLFAGCKNNTTDKTESTNEILQSGEFNNESESETVNYYASYLPDKDCEGYEFRVIGLANGYFGLNPAVDVEAENGETVNDSVYKRNRLIEERYNIRIKQTTVAGYDDPTIKFKTSVFAGSDDFDLCLMISRDAWAQAISGMIIPVKELRYLDVSQPWYAHDVNKHISIGGKLYFAYSDECLNMFEQTICVMFNKKLVADLELENLYNLVKNNKWTIDKFFELSRKAVADLDGDGKMTDADQYGILSQADMFYASFWVSSGIKTVGKDANDYLIFTGDSEKLYNVLEKVYQNIFGGEKIMFDGLTDKNNAAYAPDIVSNQFENNLGLFYVSFVGQVPNLRAMETDFGILPVPKYDESQDKYYSRVIDGWINCVPITAQDLDRISIIMEALAVESKNITMPAYFETALRTKYSRDDESKEMLDIIYANRTTDLGDTFYMDPVRNTYVSVLMAKKNDFASSVEKNMKAINKVLDKANETVAALDNIG